MKWRRLKLYFLASLVLACSQPNSDTIPPPNFQNNQSIVPRYLGDGGLKSISKKIDARASWQDFGISVREGQSFYIRSTGEWSTGESKIGSNSDRTEILKCDARGCNGDGFFPYGHPDSTFDEIILNNNGSPASKLHHIFYTIENIERGDAEDFGSYKMGFANGRLDGKVVCFSADNRLLGSETTNLAEDGHWRDRRIYWEDLKEEFEDNTNISAAITNLINLYKNAKCSAPPTSSQIETAIRNLRTAGLLWDETELVFEPVYYAQVPSDNFKLACNSRGEIILSYAFGKPHSKILKNECAPTTRASLVMKILGTSENLNDVEPNVIGKDFENSLIEASKTGRVYFRANDLDADIHNNSGTLDVSLVLEE